LADPRAAIEHRYKNIVMDSERWSGFEARDGDILICSPYKAGTTWTQMICAQLIFQKPQLERKLTEYSPWLDMRIEPAHDVLALYERQEHRRFIKTHTPLDGLPYFENVIYLCVARDPLDVFMSMLNQLRNADPETQARLVKNAGLEVGPPGGHGASDASDALAEPAPDVHGMFERWCGEGTFEWEADGWPYWSAFHHARTFWKHRSLPNVHFFHYADLSEDLEGEMRRMAELLDIEVSSARWPELVEAATFANMKRNADRLAPGVDHKLWRDNARFFNKGTSGQWRDVLEPDAVARYRDVMNERYDPAMVRWMNEGARKSGDPKEKR